MKYLSTLTPAETLIVTTEGHASLPELLKITMLDLLLKQVLTVNEVTRRPNKREERTYKYVMPGEAFKNYRPQQHEIVILKAFDGPKQILFKHIVSISFENAKSFKSYRRKLVEAEKIQPCFYLTLWQQLFGGITFSMEGTQIREQIVKEMETLEKELPDLIQRDRKAALEVLKKLGGNVVLLKNLKFSELEIFNEYVSTYQEEEVLTPSYGPVIMGCTSWSDFDHHHHSSDSGCWGGGGDSGCSSGCSGCSSSGCSGCGGGCGGGD